MRDELWKGESPGCAREGIEERLVDAPGVAPIRVATPPMEPCAALIETQCVN